MYVLLDRYTLVGTRTPNESPERAADRRGEQWMGVQIVNLKKKVELRAARYLRSTNAEEACKATHRVSLVPSSESRSSFTFSEEPI
jgi:hypothetical protein